MSIPESAIILETVHIVKFIDEDGEPQTECYYGDPKGDRDTDYGEVLKMLEACRYTVYRELMLDDLREDIISEIRAELDLPADDED